MLQLRTGVSTVSLTALGEAVLLLKLLEAFRPLHPGVRFRLQKAVVGGRFSGPDDRRVFLQIAVFATHGFPLSG
jgi:hypothetical protein